MTRFCGKLKKTDKFYGFGGNHLLWWCLVRFSVINYHLKPTFEAKKAKKDK